MNGSKRSKRLPRLPAENEPGRHLTPCTSHALHLAQVRRDAIIKHQVPQEENCHVHGIRDALALLTAEQFADRPDPGYPEELVKGRVVPMAVPKPRHGEICVNAVFIFNTHVKANDLGRIVGNDSGVITECGPDTVRGADVAFYSFARVPKGPLPDRYLDIPPDLIVEVLSPTDRWPKVLARSRVS